jgi:hypothetical protein
VFAFGSGTAIDSVGNAPQRTGIFAGPKRFLIHAHIFLCYNKIATCSSYHNKCMPFPQEKTMKTVTTMLVLAVSAFCTSVAYAQAGCVESCEEGKKQCITQNTKLDVWGNKLVTPEKEKACQDSAQECRKNCMKPQHAK